jgi:putative endonuclease
MTYFVYILRSEKTGRTYVGFCEEISVRLKRHNAGEVKATRSGRPWHVLWTDELPDYESARHREKYLKSGAGRRWTAAHLFEVRILEDLAQRAGALSAISQIAQA